ncbi:signal recognition particle SRP19 subunit [Babesia divergens]|uniref:Signal recognition particle SRP19 subunit n=1 Tax=Babesia divergens TaxID=32595 RepID=A0AAD9GFD0_BABDI|nr:signal recognition particle SRP19 subunit [Babesia divergens]
MASQPSGEDTSTWTIIYPTYLDKKASASGGRRVNKAFAVENPHVEEIRAACEKLKVPYVLERNKVYPRDFMNPGRIRVSFRHPGAECKSRTKCEFLREIAQLVAQLKSRREAASPTTSSGSSKPSRKKKK